jgi:hypothetical protein
MNHDEIDFVKFHEVGLNGHDYGLLRHHRVASNGVIGDRGGSS